MLDKHLRILMASFTTHLFHCVLYLCLQREGDVSDIIREAFPKYILYLIFYILYLISYILYSDLSLDCSEGASKAFLDQLLYCERTARDYHMSHHDVSRLQNDFCFPSFAFLARWRFKGKKTYVVRSLQGSEACKNLREISFHFLPTVVCRNCNR